VLFLYNTLFFLLIAIGFPVIVPIMLASEKRRKTVLQRLGLVSLPAGIILRRSLLPEKKNLWIHALSVGEALSAVSLVKRLRKDFDKRNIVFSVTTKTGFDIANKHLNDVVDALFYFPYDLAFSVKHIAKKIDPALVVIVETDIWPNFLHEMEKRKIPVVLVNARLSGKSFIGYKRLGFITRSLFLCFANVCTQSIEDAVRFIKLGVPRDRITVTGNVKFDEEVSSLSVEEIDRWKQSFHIRHSQKILVAGSTHPGEESILLDVISRMKNHGVDLVLVIAPRDPQRAGSLYRMFHSAGLSVGLMKELQEISEQKRLDVIIIDRLGILKTLYAIADVAFVGGSLVNRGGHNPLEPAAFKKPIIFGQDMSDFENISKMMLEANGAVRVQNANELYNVATLLIEKDTEASEVGENAYRVFIANKGTVEKTLKVIKEYL
jgi:3-deoxy-D-manno-octulosonic-acid transferase